MRSGELLCNWKRQNSQPAATAGANAFFTEPYDRGTENMITTPQIIQTTVQIAAVIRLTVPRSEIQTVMGPGIGEVMEAVKAQGIGPVGPWFAHHLTLNPATFDLEISVPVSARVMPVGRVMPGEWPALKMVRTVMHGSYEGLGNAWVEFTHWINANGYVTGADLYECYTVGPESSQDPANWRTELSKTLIG